ncbi:endonuclease V isoform X4 [Larus michahellis]|uniref:endonuclease V isoform X4 n=1 Tax=Larus michahellis TaxID=119627 RepID=UPI003D9BB890
MKDFCKKHHSLMLGKITLFYFIFYNLRILVIEMQKQTPPPAAPVATSRTGPGKNPPGPRKPLRPRPPPRPRGRAPLPPRRCFPIKLVHSLPGTASLRPRSRGDRGGEASFRRAAMAGRAAPPPDATLRAWEREQARLGAGVVEEDTEEWQRDPGFAGLERVGGVDLSYIKGDDSSACASLVVLSYPALEVLYEDCRMVTVSAPYVAGFLAFREVPFLVEAVQRLQQEEPRLRPQVLLVDGNGLLHPRGFGVACHLGVLTDLPCIGVAKNLLQVDGLVRDELHREQIRSLQREGDTFPLTGTSGRALGMGVPGDSRASSQVLLQVPDPGAHPSARRIVKQLWSCVSSRQSLHPRHLTRDGGRWGAS